MNATASPLRYDSRSIRLHWLTALLVGLLWALGQTIDWFPKGDARIAARGVHIVLGVVLAGVVAVRISWRLGGGTRLPPSGAGALDKLATATHKLLYVLLIAAIVLGLANAWVRGDSLFGLWSIPAFDPGNKGLRESVEDWHELAANTLFFVALAHAAAGLLHHYVFKDDVLRRMLR